MTYRATFASGRHLAAARTLAGLKQTELAKLAGLHVNSLKRLERMAEMSRQCQYSLERLAKALKAKVSRSSANRNRQSGKSDRRAPEFSVACIMALTHSY